jgi:hypothetical protein
MLNFKEYSQELDAVAETVELTQEELSQLDEVLDTTARLKRKALFKRRGARIALARKLQAKRLATPDRLKKRSRLRAKGILIKRLFQGRTMSEIPISQRAQVSKKLERLKGTISRVSTKLLRRVKQDDIARKTGKKVSSAGHSGAL